MALPSHRRNQPRRIVLDSMGHLSVRLEHSVDRPGAQLGLGRLTQRASAGAFARLSTKELLLGRKIRSDCEDGRRVLLPGRHGLVSQAPVSDDLRRSLNLSDPAADWNSSVSSPRAAPPFRLSVPSLAGFVIGKDIVLGDRSLPSMAGFDAPHPGSSLLPPGGHPTGSHREAVVPVHARMVRTVKPPHVTSASMQEAWDPGPGDGSSTGHHREDCDRTPRGDRRWRQRLSVRLDLRRGVWRAQALQASGRRSTPAMTQKRRISRMDAFNVGASGSE